MRFFSIFVVFTLIGAGAIGCSEPADRVEITETAERSEHRPPVQGDVSNAERFQFLPSAQDFAMTEADPAEAGFHAQTPEGWTELPPTQFRLLNYQFGPNGEGECYVSLLPGGGGGLKGNVDRWRAQMGLESYTQEEFENLPRRSIIDGQPAVFVDFEGAYTGMGETAAKDGYRMLGLLSDTGVFIKMVGPSELVAAEREHFEQMVASIHSAAGHSHGPEPVAAAPTADTGGALPAGHPPLDSPETMQLAQAQSDEEPRATENESGEGSAEGFTWKIPEGWTQAPERMMRLVTYNVEGSPETECYISLLGGSAGGLVANVNRWIAQFGGDPLSEEAIDLLPKIEMLGRDVPLVETTGDFTTMRGEEKPDQALLGTAWITDDVSVFVKMTGPEETVKNQKENFIAFCESLKRQ